MQSRQKKVFSFLLFGILFSPAFALAATVQDFYLKVVSTTSFNIQFGTNASNCRANIYYSSGWRFYVEGSGCGASGVDNSIPNSSPVVGSWSHVLIDYTGSNYTVFFDGVSAGVVTNGDINLGSKVFTNSSDVSISDILSDCSLSQNGTANCSLTNPGGGGGGGNQVLTATSSIDQTQQNVNWSISLGLVAMIFTVSLFRR